MKKFSILCISFFLILTSYGCNSRFDEKAYLKDTKKFSELQFNLSGNFVSEDVEKKFRTEEDIEVIHTYFYKHNSKYKKAYDQAKKLDEYNVKNAPEEVKNFHNTIKNPFQLAMKEILYEFFSGPERLESFSQEEQDFINKHIFDVSKERKEYRKYLKKHGNPSLYVFS